MTVPATIEALRDAVLAAFDDLSPRLRQVGRHLIDEPNDLAFETLATVAAKIGVQPSTIVRFAQQFGFEGAAPMQRMLRSALLQQPETTSYTERLRQFTRSLPDTEIGDPGQMLAEFAQGNIHALEHLPHLVGNRDLATAIEMIDRARTVFVVGFRRAFPVASYLAYLLARAGKPIVLVDGLAGLASLQLQGAASADLAIAISYAPYAAETIELVDQVADRAIPSIAISDSAISPIAQRASLLLQVREVEIRGFRSIAASMALVQTLAIFFGLASASDAATAGTRPAAG